MARIDERDINFDVLYSMIIIRYLDGEEVTKYSLNTYSDTIVSSRFHLGLCKKKKTLIFYPFVDVGGFFRIMNKDNVFATEMIYAGKQNGGIQLTNNDFIEDGNEILIKWEYRKI